MQALRSRPLVFAGVAFAVLAAIVLCVVGLAVSTRSPANSESATEFGKDPSLRNEGSDSTVYSACPYDLNNGPKEKCDVLIIGAGVGGFY